MTLLSVPLGLLSYRASFMSKYQVLYYCSLAKPDPHTKSYSGGLRQALDMDKHC